MRRSEPLEAVRRASLDQVDRVRCLRNAYDTRCPSRRTVRPMVETKTRRGRSRPGVYQRRGRWYYTVDIKDPASGKWRKVWSHAFDRQADAYEARIEALDRVRRHELVDPGRLTVGEYLERWVRSRPVGFGVR